MRRFARMFRVALPALMVVMISAVGVQADELGGDGFAVPTAQPVTAPPPPWVELETRHVAAGVGVRWGSGQLLFEGESHAFTLKGVSLADAGISRMLAEGEVENLARIEDFAGRYVAVEIGAALGKGVSKAVLRNEHGVVIRLSSQTTGLALTLGAEGFQIALR